MSGPVDIATSRQSSGSPRSQKSNLTTQFQQPRIDVQESNMAPSNHAESQPQYRGRQESVGMLGTTPYGARTIPVGSAAFRGENHALSGSLMNGMSWGGISVGSFIRDE